MIDRLLVKILNSPTGIYIYLLTKELFIDIFGEEFGTLYMGGSIPDFHTADCYYGTWVRES